MIHNSRISVVITLTIGLFSSMSILSITLDEAMAQAKSAKEKSMIVLQKAQDASQKAAASAAQLKASAAQVKQSASQAKQSVSDTAKGLKQTGKDIMGIFK